MTMTQIVSEHSQDDSTLTSRHKSLSPPPHQHPATSNMNHRSLDSLSPTPSSRPKLHTIHSSDTSRFPTLEKLENSMMLSKNSKITIEPVTFPGDYTNGNNNNNNMTKSNGSQSDVKSIHSTTSNHKKRNQYRKKKNYQSTPTEIFAKNLSEAVLDVDDSFEDGYVYNTKGGLYPSLSPPIPFESKSNHRSAASSNDEANNYFSDHHKQKFRRPGLRSTVSELPARGVKSVYLDSMSSKFEKQKFRNSHYRCSSSSGEEGDEENAPLLYYSSSSSNTRRRRMYEGRRLLLGSVQEIYLQFQFVVVGYLSSVLAHYSQWKPSHLAMFWERRSN
ncbi:hypothetical protein MBANPS3_005350 [Mucor bainieri]